MKIKTKYFAKFLYLSALVPSDPILEINKNIRLVRNQRGVVFMAINGDNYQTIVNISPSYASAEEDAFQFDDNDPAQFDIGVDASKFFSTIKSISSDYITIAITENKMVIKATGLRVALPIIAGNEFTDYPIDHTAPILSINLSNSMQLSNISKLANYTAKDNGSFSGVALWLAQGSDTITLYASTHASVIYKTMANIDEGVSSEVSMLLSREIVDAISHLNIFSDDSTVAITLHEDNTLITIDFTTDTGVHGHFFGRQLAARPVDVSSIYGRLDGDFNLVNVNKKELLSAIKLYTIVCPTNGITLNVHDSVINISGQDFNSDVAITFADNIPHIDASLTVDTKWLTSILNDIQARSDIISIKYKDDTLPMINVLSDSDSVILAKIRRF